MAAVTGTRFAVQVGSVTALRVPRFWIRSERHAPLVRAGITLPDPEGTLYAAISTGDAVSVNYGYRDQDATTWQGTVRWVRHGSKDQLEIGAVGLESALADVQIVQHWRNETPEAIMQQCLSKCGLSAGTIDAPGITLPHFQASSKPVWEIAQALERTIQRATGQDMSKWTLFAGSDGLVHWGDQDDPAQTSVPVISTGAGLIKHMPAADKAGLSRIVTWLIPGFQASQLFELNDKRRGVSGQFRAQKVEHLHEQQATRTIIFYGEEYDQHGY